MRRTYTSGDTFGNSSPLVGRFVRELRTFDDVADGPHTR